jgi:hypothetical protein
MATLSLPGIEKNQSLNNKLAEKQKHRKIGLKKQKLHKNVLIEKIK